MDNETRKYLKREIDKRARERDNSLSPDDLTVKAAECDELGYPELAESFRNIRDKLVNPLLGEGWTLERIERAAHHYFKRKQGNPK